MANIPGIVGYVAPGSFSLNTTRSGAVTLPGGPTVIAILGQGRREEFIVTKAVGGGADGSPYGFVAGGTPDGRHYQLSCYPVVPGTIELFINPTGSTGYDDTTDLPLIQITSQAMATAWAGEFGDTATMSDPTALALGIGTGTVAASYAVLAATTITNVGSSVIAGSLGLSPGTSVTGFPPGTVSGSKDIANSNAAAGQTAALALYNKYSSLAAGTTVSTLDGLTLTPGTYTSASTMSLAASGNGTLTLNGAGVYVFQVGSALTTGSGGIPTITLTNGATAASVYWVVGSSATLNSGFPGTFYGNLVAQASITVTAGGTVNGSLAALTGAITLSAATTIVASGGAPGVITYQPDSLDGYQGTDDGSGTFFNTKWGKQFQQLKQQLGITTGSPEPNHYIFDPSTGRIVLDQALNANDTLVASYLCTSDLNSPQMFFDLPSIYAKHGYPSFYNTIATAAQIAFANGAGVVMPVQAGLTLQGAGQSQVLISEPTLQTALAALELEDEVEIVIPITQSRIYNEIVVAFYNSSIDGVLTGNGAFLQDGAAPGSPGLQVTPLAVNPVGTANAGNPTFLNLYKNGVILQYGVDYSIPNVAGTPAGPMGSINALIALSPSYPGATHTNDNTLVDGDKITADYLPSLSTINLVATAQLAVLNHCELMSETRNRLERTCMFGAYEFVNLDFILDPVEGIVANFGNSYRAMFFYPGGNTLNLSLSGQSVMTDAQYIAPAAAGFVAAHPIPQPLTNQTLLGFTIPANQKLSVAQTTLVGGAGVAIVRPLASGGLVVQGLTTNSDGSATDQEYSVTRVRDYVAVTVRSALQSAYVGKLLTTTIANDIKNTTNSILSALVSQGVLNAYANVTAAVDPEEPRQVDVSFDITPVFPLNWIFISFTVGS